MPPTEKQIAYADDIAKELGLDFPSNSKDYTRYTYSKFISKYKKDFDLKYDFVDEDYLYEYVSENDVWCEHY